MPSGLLFKKVDGSLINFCVALGICQESPSRCADFTTIEIKPQWVLLKECNCVFRRTDVCSKLDSETTLHTFVIDILFT